MPVGIDIEGGASRVADLSEFEVEGVFLAALAFKSRGGEGMWSSSEGGETSMEARYLTNEDGERVGVVLGAEEYGAIMEVYDGVAKASRAIEEAEASSSESRLEFEARIAEAQKALGEAARKLEAVHRDFPPR